MARATLGRCTGPYLDNGVIPWLIRYFYHAQTARARRTPWVNQVHFLRLPPLPVLVSHMLHRTLSVIHLLRTAPHPQHTLTGTLRWRTGTTSGRWASRLLKLWTQPSAVWELIRRSVADARAIGASIACGAGTDQLVPSAHVTLADVQAAYEEQCSFIEGKGGRIILMASRALASCARTPDDYIQVYDRILTQVSQPVILHWLGDMFDPALACYWGYQDLDAAMMICLSIIERHAAKIDGIKISLLNADREIAMRRRLPLAVRMYTGDDFNYPELIRGDEQGYSHALLGIFDAIAPAASAALQALDAGDVTGYTAILAPTVPLSHHIFQAPTYYYKTGVVFLAYLNGHQSHFRMVAGLESARSVVHLAELFILADKAGLIRDPELATERMRRVLVVAGIV